MKACPELAEWEGAPIEIDLTSEWPLLDGQGQGVWLVQVRYTKKPMGPAKVGDFLEQTETVLAEKEYATVTRWYFCKQGYTIRVERPDKDFPKNKLSQKRLENP